MSDEATASLLSGTLIQISGSCATVYVACSLTLAVLFAVERSWSALERIGDAVGTLTEPAAIFGVGQNYRDSRIFRGTLFTDLGATHESDGRGCALYMLRSSKCLSD